MLFLTFLKIMHLSGLMAGFGGALYTDYLMISGGILRPLKPQTLIEVKRLSRVVTWGLVLLWISGAALAYEAYLTNEVFLENEKFWAKMVMVVILTLNGFFVHYVVLREAERSINKRLLIDSPLPVLVLLAATGLISFVSWTLPFILGKASEFSYVLPFGLFMSVWLILVLSAVAGVLSLVALHDLWTRYQAKGTRRPHHQNLCADRAVVA
ncbi:MAG: hypothetical protein H2045_03975 [Rhizobiales bacterium]|nr:hypothetical protein [Hyphomicrobiales bacterium]